MDETAENSANHDGQASKKPLRAQAAIEYLSMYGWAFLIVGVVAALLYIFVLVPTSVIPNSCGFLSGAYCYDLVTSSNMITGATTYTFLISNSNPYAIANPKMTLDINNANGSQNNCIPSFTYSGGTILCTITVSGTTPYGKLVSGKAYLNMTQCTSVTDGLLCSKGIQQIYLGTFASHVGPPESSAITMLLNAAPYNIKGYNWSDNVTATVKFAGYAFRGAAIQFSQTNPQFTLNPSISTANSNGSASTQVSSPLVWNSITQVTASFGGATNTLSLQQPFHFSFFNVTPNPLIEANTETFTINWTYGIAPYNVIVYYNYETGQCGPSFVSESLTHELIVVTGVPNPDHEIIYRLLPISGSEPPGIPPGDYLCAFIQDSTGNTAYSQTIYLKIIPP